MLGDRLFQLSDLSVAFRGADIDGAMVLKCVCFRLLDRIIVELNLYMRDATCPGDGTCRTCTYNCICILYAFVPVPVVEVVLETIKTI